MWPEDNIHDPAPAPSPTPLSGRIPWRGFLACALVAAAALALHTCSQ